LYVFFHFQSGEKQHTYNKYANKTQFPILIQHHHPTKALENYYWANLFPAILVLQLNNNKNKMMMMMMTTPLPVKDLENISL
jgi:hypothetical protein